MSRLVAKEIEAERQVALQLEVCRHVHPFHAPALMALVQRQQGMVELHYRQRLLRRILQAWHVSWLGVLSRPWAHAPSLAFRPRAKLKLWMSSGIKCSRSVRSSLLCSGCCSFRLQAQQAQLLLRLQRQAQAPTSRVLISSRDLDFPSISRQGLPPAQVSSDVHPPSPPLNPTSRIPRLRATAVAPNLSPPRPASPPPQPPTTQAYQSLLQAALASADTAPEVLRNMSARAQRRQTLKQQRLARLQQKEQQAEVESTTAGLLLLRNIDHVLLGGPTSPR